MSERYTDLSPEQRQNLLSDMDRRYWDAMDWLAAITTERALLKDVIKTMDCDGITPVEGV